MTELHKSQAKLCSYRLAEKQQLGKDETTDVWLGCICTTFYLEAAEWPTCMLQFSKRCSICCHFLAKVTKGHDEEDTGLMCWQGWWFQKMENKSTKWNNLVLFKVCVRLKEKETLFCLVVVNFLVRSLKVC